jgi:hypothetical protein
MGATQTRLTTPRSVLKTSPKVLNSAQKKILIEKHQDKIIDGNVLAYKIKAGLKQHILEKSAERGSRPMLGHLIVGELA